MLNQIKILRDEISKLEYKIDNETEIIYSNESLSLEKIKRLIHNELVKTKNKIVISKLIYDYQNCDSYEDFL